MKKFLFILLLSTISFSTANAQVGPRLGANIGLPVGDASDFYSFQAGADLAYMFTAIPLIDVGPMVGYSRFFGDDDNGDVHFLPLAASGRLNLATFTLGLDLGYALGLSEGIDGGVYYRPQVGFNILMLGLIASYQGISVDGGTFSSVNLGVEFQL